MTFTLEAVGGAVALLIAILSGWLTKALLDSKGLRLKGARGDVPDLLWSALQPGGIEKSGALLGHIERILALVSAWTGQYEIIGGWFAFKVAAKWETYSSLLRLPEKVEGIDDLTYLRARRAWGSRMMMRFLVGSGANAILGIMTLPRFHIHQTLLAVRLRSNSAGA
jgi:hypothetical protein